MKLFLQCVEAQEPAARDVLLAALPREDVALVRESSAVAWLPASVNARSTEIVWRALGPGAREMFFLRLGIADFDSSMLSSLLSSAVRLFGVDPGRLLRWTPRGWTQVYRDATKITVESTSETTARLRFEALPRCLARCEGWMESVACSLTALYSVTGRTGTAIVEERDAAGRTMVIGFRWPGLE